MSSDAIKKEKIDTYLKDVAKEYRRLNGKSMPAEIILIGGASILINYSFRSMTGDIDAIIDASSSMRDAISIVRDRYELPNDWLNDDFVRSDSYSKKLVMYSKYYKTYSNIVQIRTVSGVYLIAMKLVAGRIYKNDLSDIVGILAEHQKENEIFTMGDIEKAIIDLYGSLEVLPTESRKFLEDIIDVEDYDELYKKVRNTEIRNKEDLLEFQKEHPDQMNRSNISNVIEMIRNKQRQGE